MLTSGITNHNFYCMIDIVLLISSTYQLQNQNGDDVPRNAEPLLPGHYLVVADGTVELNNEYVVPRTESLSGGTRVQCFRNEVRARDRRCVVSKRENILADAGIWEGFEAAHIFPLGYERYWIDQQFGRWITLPPEHGGRINSAQNGLLLYGGIHTSFDHFVFSINPDVGFRSVLAVILYLSFANS